LTLAGATGRPEDVQVYIHRSRGASEHAPDLGLPDELLASAEPPSPLRRETARHVRRAGPLASSLARVDHEPILSDIAQTLLQLIDDAADRLDPTVPAVGPPGSERATARDRVRSLPPSTGSYE
jgi:hypothetical protein